MATPSEEQRRSAENEYQRHYRKLKPEKNRLACKRWREKNREKELARNRAKGKKYRERNKAKQRAYMQLWRPGNQDKILEYTHRRRALKASTQVDVSGIARWMREIKTKPFVRCHWCGTKIHGKQVRFDHIVPLSKGGPHIISNLCACCQDCNASKAARAISEWIVGGQSFLPL